MMNTKPNGMYKIMIALQKTLQNDEQLMRLLYYPPENSNGTKDPLDESLPDILIDDYDKLYQEFSSKQAEIKIRIVEDIINNRFKTTPTSPEIESMDICRIYLYTDDRNPTKSYMVANQNFNIDIFCHESFEEDYRTARILDRINEILLKESTLGKPIAGMGQIEFVRGRRFSAVKGYSSYASTYVVGAN